MKSELQQLLSKVRSLVEPRGERARLARYLGVDAPRISEWLGGDCAPSGETTLKLLRWVEQHGDQNTKAPEVLRTPPEPKTRSSKSRYEKAKSNPPKP